ncbi:YdiU family protein [Aliidiomarina minuta]|uniref:Protein nucleotidyltransferase YdiU n=1 Tax=Aliidiomarina minuta TaxID=880057 RepID=A0A432W3K0_9GAMM|nr:YdiU family protein [Aliidiomarina minuta]RUO23944.1 YdiU family protein [Aliidiomarina minuta]
MQKFNVDNSYQRLPDSFFKRTTPTPVADPQWISFNQPLADQLDLPQQYWASDEGLQLFAGNSLPDWSDPVAQGYAGHQFANFVAQLGDGRAILLAEIIDKQKRRFDIQLKGAGTTAYSRGGDGRSPIGPVIREYLLSEAMHVLGVPTTRALAAVATGETVHRDVPQPGAILTRVASSHIRIGTFQFIAAHQGTGKVQVLADYVINRHYPDCKSAERPYLAMLEAVIQKQAELVSHWMSLGFIHGVMNTDNMSISGETIDYGPCAFIDNYHPDALFSSIDRGGRYAYSNQPKVAQWNLARLAECLVPLIDKDEEKAVELATEALKTFSQTYEDLWLTRMAAKIGIREPQPEDRALLNELLDLMADDEVDFTLLFRALCDSLEADHCLDLFKQQSACKTWLQKWRQRLSQESASGEETALQMRLINPAIIPRNHRVQEAILAAEQEGDLRPFNELKAALAEPFSDNPEYQHLTLAPKPEEKVQRTFCGT